MLPLELTYPAQLPITERRAEIVAALRAHQVVIVAGETGSGKSTQLPKLCLEAGRGDRALIGHTQPRRLAARTIAERVAEELGTELGDVVGYTVRFTDRVGPDTRIKVMTDGILLAEIQRDRMLRRYDTIIIDEAHERSLNIDFLLGYLRQLLPQRPDLHVVITSATIDTARFAEHFADAPVIEVSGRTFPVEVRYRPFGTGLPLDVDSDADEDRDADAQDDGERSGGERSDGDVAGGGPAGGERSGGRPPGRGRSAGERPRPERRPDRAAVDQRDQIQAIVDACAELGRAGPGDVLVFLSGEREIHDAADALRRLDLRDTDVLPLYARLSAAEQHRIFQPHAGRRIVLSTNVAETSLTVPGVRYVVDAGTARMSRYSTRLKVQRLPIEPVSQASANQRAGRCGRVAPGICIRLYDADDFASRPEFTEPEILRTNLAAVILQMTALGLGDVAAFPFIDPPDSRAIRDGVMLLEELGALDPGQAAEHRRLTPLGTRLARLPVDPRLGRMVLEADRYGCVREVMVIAAALSIQDPRERPAEHRQAAEEAHRRFATDGSDFLALLRLWDHLREQQRTLSSNQFRRLCRSEFLNYLRVREWQDLFSQLRQAAGAVGIRPGTEDGHPDRIHQALLSGLLSHIGMREGLARDYRGARGARFLVGRESSAAKKAPRWVMAAGLVETNRLWARTVAPIQPEWAERVGAHLVVRSYGEPVWDEQRGAAVTIERVSLYGLPIVSGRRVGYDRIDRGAARAMFIQHALVQGEWTTHHRFVAENRAVIDDLVALAERTRRAQLVDDEAVFAFYDGRVAADVVSMRHFDRWWKDESKRHPDLLRLTPQALLEGRGGGLDPDDFPTVWHQDDLQLEVTYRFAPGAPGDGVTVHIPLPVLNRVRDEGFDWQVAGFRADLISALVRSLPKHLRRPLSPLAEASDEAYRRAEAGSDTLREELSRVLTDIAGVQIRARDLDPTRVPEHLQITFAVDDEHGNPIATGTDLGALRRLLAKPLRAVVAAAGPSVERTGITRWDVGDLPRTVETVRDGLTVLGYPALLDDEDSVSIRVFTNPGTQERAMRTGLRRLLLLTAPVPLGPLQRRLTNNLRLGLAGGGFTSAGLAVECVVAVADAIVAEHGADVWTEGEFAALVALARPRLAAEAGAALQTAAEVVRAATDVRAQLARLVTPAVKPSVDDMRSQLDRLVRPGFVAATGVARLPDVLRYVRGIERRAVKVPEDPRRDQQRMLDVTVLEDRYRAVLARQPRGPVPAEVIDAGWLLEELRISVFAQSLGTPRPVSPQRMVKALAALR